MHRVDLLCSFVSYGSGVTRDDSGNERFYYFLNTLAEDGSIDRFPITADLHKFLSTSAISIGDLCVLTCELRSISSERKWYLKPVSIKLS